MNPAYDNVKRFKYFIDVFLQDAYIKEFNVNTHYTHDSAPTACFNVII